MTEGNNTFIFRFICAFKVITYAISLNVFSNPTECIIRVDYTLIRSKIISRMRVVVVVVFVAIWVKEIKLLEQTILTLDFRCSIFLANYKQIRNFVFVHRLNVSNVRSLCCIYGANLRQWC